MTLSRRVLATVLFSLLAMTASLTVAAAPASAAYSSQVICNRHTAHRGQAVACILHHFPKHHHGTVTVTARYWVHDSHKFCRHHRHHCRNHHRHLSRHSHTKVLTRFVTSRHGGRIVGFVIPQHIRKGSHLFHFNVGHVRHGKHIRVV